MNRDTLLIVDDIEMNRALLRGCFDECYNILEAENGQQAIEILKRHTVNIVITDIFMPIIDGFELTKQIKQDILLQNLPVIVITDRGEEFEMRALKSGADDFINKPFRKELLQHRVDSVLSQQCYSKNYSLRPFPYSHIKLPFAIVKLENDSHVAHYQYVNETFAAECRTEKENMLENVNDIHSAEFCEFLRNTDGKDGFCQKTFFVPEQNDYFDVVAYAQGDGFYCFTITHNEEKAADLHRQKELSQILEKMLMVNPNILGGLYLNLTKGICVGGSGSSEYFNKKEFPVDILKLTEDLSKYLVLPKDKKRLEQFMDRSCTEIKENGTYPSRAESFLVRQANGNVHWVSIQMEISKNRESGEIEAFAVGIDESEKKLSQRIIDYVVKKDYDTLLYIDLKADTATIFTNKTEPFWSEPISVKRIDEEIQGYLERSYIGEDKEKFLSENRISYISNKMQTIEDYSVDYWLSDNGKPSLKRGHYYWLDESHSYLCFTRTDITESFEQEQRRSLELSQKLQEAREDERRHIAQQERLKEEYYERMRQNGLMMSNLLENIPGGVAVYKIGEPIKTLYSSEGIPKLSGRTMEEYQKWIEGDLLGNTIFEDDMNSVVSQIKLNTPHGLPINVTYRLKHKNGTCVWVMLSAVKIREEDGCPIYYAIYTSVPEQVAKYMQICESSPTAIHVVDTKTNEILFVNEEAKRISGQTEGSIGQKCYEAICHNDSFCAFCSMHEAVYDHFTEKNIYIPYMDRYYCMKSKLLDWNGREAYVTYLTDETSLVIERKHAEHLRQAEEANAAKTAFLSRVSHDMRTPLNAIIGLSYLAKEKDDLQEIKQNIQSIEESGMLLLNLVNDTLDMSKIESGRLELHPVICDVKQLISAVIGIIKPAAAKKNIEFYISENIVTHANVLADTHRLQQIFINLLSNAVKFTPSGGTVVWSSECLWQKDGKVCNRFMVKDNGIGIKEEFMPHIYETFSQENRMNTDNEAGTGLGLSIVKKLVDLMGGTIEINSREEKGTEVSVILKFDVSDGNSHLFEQCRTKFIELREKRILLCEDHPLNSQIVEKLLKSRGMIVDTAKNGKIGLEIFKSSPVGSYDAILMDIRMPIMNGLEATKAIRCLNREDAQNIPIISLTANAFSGDIKQAIDAGMNAHLSKPVIPEQLFDTLGDWLSKKISNANNDK